MPRISSFCGIVIKMYLDEARHESRPHFYATHAGEDATVDIESLELIAGKLPRRAQGLVLEWAGSPGGAAP